VINYVDSQKKTTGQLVLTSRSFICIVRKHKELFEKHNQLFEKGNPLYKHTTLSKELLFIIGFITFIYQVSYNKYSYCNKKITQFMAVFRHFSYQLFFSFNARYAG